MRLKATRRRFLKQAATSLGLGMAGGLVSDGCSTSAGATGSGIARGQLGASIDNALRSVPVGAALSVAVADGSEIVYGKGFGRSDPVNEVRAGIDTVYDICSITKQFTAAAIMALETAGSLRTSDLLSRFVQPAKPGITLHQLLTHTAGLPDHSGDDYDPLSRERLLDRAAAVRLEAKPGSRFGYSNIGYSLLAAVIEKVTGTSYESYLADALFEPAGMKHTGYRLPRWGRDQIAVQYDESGKSHGRPLDLPWDTDGPYWNLRGNGGLLSTPHDMVRWHRALRSGRVLSAAAKRRMFTPHVHMEDQDRYGYGWIVRGDGPERIVWHDGGNGWSSGEFYLLPDTDRMLFWMTSTTARHGKWDLIEPGPAAPVLDVITDG